MRLRGENVLQNRLATTGALILVLGFLLLPAPCGARTSRAAPGMISGELATGAGVVCSSGTLPGGALYLICTPEDWNGGLVLYAHGYVSPLDPISLPDDSIDGVSVSELINQMGLAYATTSYRRNGLVVPGAVDDLLELVSEFDRENQPAKRIYLMGVSEGGLVATLALENHPEFFDGALAAGAPVGDFRQQIDFLGDFLVVFNYFFPGLLDGAAPAGIPDRVVENWDTDYVPKVRSEIQANPSAARQLLKVMRVPADIENPETDEGTVLELLRYNIFATNDAIGVLGGRPFDNSNRNYSGSEDDLRLNRRVDRFHADSAAVEALERYRTSGQLSRPLVTIHTTGDPIVPYWQEVLYSWKTFLGHSGRLQTSIPIRRHGHCNFKVEDVVQAFGLLTLQATGQKLDFGKTL